MYSLTHGDVIGAARFNPLLVTGVPLLLIVIAWHKVLEKRGVTVSSRLAWIVLALVLAYFVARNVPGPARGWLVPPVLEQPNDDESREAAVQVETPWNRVICSHTSSGLSAYLNSSRCSSRITPSSARNWKLMTWLQ